MDLRFWKNDIQEPAEDETRGDSSYAVGYDFGEIGRKLSTITPGVNASRNHLSTYKSSGFAQAIINSVGDDITRTWFELETSVDDESPDIGKAIMDRLDDLGLRYKINDLIRYSRIYPDGAILYYHYTDKGVGIGAKLEDPPKIITELQYIAIATGSDLEIHMSDVDPLKDDRIEIRVTGRKLHKERYSWLVNSWIDEDETGISVIDSIFMPLVAHSSAVWSSANIAKELLLKVVKTDASAGSPTKFAEYIGKIATVLNSKSILGIGKDEDFIKQTPSLSGIKDLFEFVESSLAGAGQIPKSRLFGNSQGTLAGADNDTNTYYDSVSRLANGKITEIIDKVISIILKEPAFAKYSNITWTVNWLPLWEESPDEIASRKFKEAQANQIYLTTGVLSPSEVRAKDFEELEEFAESEVGNLNFTVPKPPNGGLDGGPKKE